LQLAALSTALNWPAPHGVQARSLLAEPALLTNVPGEQTAKDVHAAALVPVLNVPPVQPEQARSVVASPADRTY
jgi:hypothetical protein